MANAASFMTQYTSNLVQLATLLNTLQQQQTQMANDPTLVTRYFQLNGARTDIVAQDVTNSSSAVGQVLFAYTSGAPTQQSFIMKLFP